MACAASQGPAPDPVAVLRAHRAAVHAVAFHTPSNTLLSGDADGELKVWDLVKHRPVFSSRVHTPSAGVLGIGVSSALENKILSQGRDGTVKCWQLTDSSLSRQPILTIKSESYHFCKLAVAGHAAANDEPCEDDRGGVGQVLMAMAGNDTSKIEIWDIASGQSVQLLSPKDSSVGMCMSLHMTLQSERGDPCTVVAGYEDGSVLMWDTRHAAAPLLQTKQHKEPVLSLVLDRQGTGGISGSADGQLTFFSLSYTESLFTPKKKFEGQAGVGDVALRGDDKIVATAGWDHRVRIYDYRRRKPLAILKYHKEIVNGVDFSEDRRWLASGSKDSTVALWSLYPPSNETPKCLE
ncbi:hypothetical protein KC19_12G165300 [Ceratodon purpureus]|uniref:Guanine nucleotide-binding protein subunit beta-like protein 1 n=1 Tax=Ceratodon purpureus TaxID=3225 RepID=A0A8T0G8K5_CERPU|nr:hypothetical protein KC19_12G165300 [Ceratodon purpureus]